MRILTRREWGAEPRPHALERRPVRLLTDFIVHHSAGSPTETPLSIQRYHIRDRGFADVGYNFLIDRAGQIFQGRGWQHVGAHTVGHNTTGLGVCLIGKDLLTDPAKAALRELYAEACDLTGHTLMIRGHRDLDATICPGPNTYRWITSGALEPVRRRTLQLADPMMIGPDVRAVQHEVGAAVDGVYGPATKAAVIRWQQKHGLVPDGIVGPITRAAMGIDS